MRVAMLSVDGWDVSYLVVVEVEGDIMLDPAEAWHRLGSVAQSSRVIDGLIRRMWEGTDIDGRQFTGDRKNDAIQAMAHGNGLRVVPTTATMPDLFDLEGTA